MDETYVGKDRRRFRRVPFEAEAKVSCNGRTWSCRLLDICINGALVEADGQVGKVGKPCEFSLELLANEAEIQTEGTIAHAEENRIGIRFDLISFEGQFAPATAPRTQPRRRRTRGAGPCGAAAQPRWNEAVTPNYPRFVRLRRFNATASKLTRLRAAHPVERDDVAWHAQPSPALVLELPRRNWYHTSAGCVPPEPPDPVSPPVPRAA